MTDTNNPSHRDIMAFIVQAKFLQATALLVKVRAARTIEHGAALMIEYNEQMQSVCGMMLEHKELLELSNKDIEKVRKEIK